MWENIKQDVRVQKPKVTKPNFFHITGLFIKNAGFRAVAYYRMGRWFRLHKLKMLAQLCERSMHHLCHCWISTEAQIGPGFRIPHVCGILIPRNTIIGENFTIRKGAMIAGNYDKLSPDGRAFPTILDNVSIGPNTTIIGPITIGSNSIIGANALVSKDVPDNSVVGTFRAEVVAQITSEGKFIRPDEYFTLSRKEMYDKLKLLEEKVALLEITIKRLECNG